MSWGKRLVWPGGMEVTLNPSYRCDTVYFDKITSTILAVGVTVPKTSFPQPIQPSVVLAVATATDIALLGLNFRDERGQPHPPGFKDYKSERALLAGRILLKVGLYFIWRAYSASMLCSFSDSVGWVDR